MATLSDVRFVWQLIGDDPDDPEWSEADVQTFLAQAAGDLYGAAALLCMAWAAKLDGQPGSVKIGSLTLDTSKAAERKRAQAKTYAAMSTTVTTDQTKRPAFGRARVDWRGQTTDAPQTDRLYQDDLEGQ
jgi:hypothetical protein